MHPIMRLDALPKKQTAIIVGIDTGEATDKNFANALEKRLLEMGFVEGRKVTLLHEAPFSRDPIIVRVHHHRVAIRRQEAHCILVQSENI